MTPERAREIVQAVNDRCFFTMDLTDKVSSLEGVSLAEMIEAASIVREGNASAGKNADGFRTISVVPDDRLIAAAYCLQHYDPSNEAVIAVPASPKEHFWHEGDLKVLAVAVVKRTASEEEEAA